MIFRKKRNFMKDRVDKLIAKYKLAPNSYYKESPYDGVYPDISKAELMLVENWQNRTKKGWYGISIGQPCPESWFAFLNEFLYIVEKYNKDFEILQIKMKYGSIRIYLDKISDETQDEVSKVQSFLHDRFLVY